MNSNYLKNIIISSLPGIISILLSLFSIPIFLKNLSVEVYANYIIQHSILSLGILLNLNIGKFAAIKIQKVDLLTKKQIIFTCTLISSIVSFFLSTLIYLILYYFFDEREFIVLSGSLLVGLFLTILYISLEYILKSLSYFKICSIFNFLFYSLSLSLPAFFLILNHYNFYIEENLFKISVIIKLFTLLCVFLILIFKKNLIFTKLNLTFLNDLKIHSKWMTISALYNQIYDYFDKYLLKIYFGPLILITYSIPQQISGKITVLSQSVIAVLLPILSKKNSMEKKKIILSTNLYLYLLFMGAILILLLPYYGKLLNWWIKEAYSADMLKLFKIFILLTFINSLSTIVITFYEAELISRKNTILETYVIFPFIIGLITSIYYQNFFIMAYSILVKEFVLALMRIFYVRNFILNLNYLIIIIILFSIIFITWI